jgi:UDP-N-acetylmuramyl pentapeptide phosphotransferase/UDP-N-acetylglucosamine-1-phosphate transferase
MSPAVLVVAFAVLAAAGWAGVLLWKPWARRLKLIDVPNPRSSHSTPTLRAGGVPMVVLTLIAMAFAFERPVIALAATAAIIAVTGFIDDIKSLGWTIRFVIQIAMAAVVIWAFGPIAQVGPLPLGLFAIPMTVLWIGGLTNAYNFMDGIDGIAGIQAVVAALGFAILGVLHSDRVITLTALAIAATALGFLFHNWPPATIFMGDVASGFLGFTFAALTVKLAQHTREAAIAGVLFVWPFLFDTIFTFFRRLLRGEKVTQAHRSHLYQRLVIAGASHGRVSSLYGLLALICAIAGIVYERGVRGGAVMAAVAAAATAVWLLVQARARSISARP